MYISTLAYLTYVASVAFADIQITSPAAGASLTPGKITITWRDSGVAPTIGQLKDYTIQLCAGGNSDGDFLPVLDVTPAPVVFTSGSSYTANIPTGRAADMANGFFLRMQSNALAGGYVVNFSDRFSMTAMGGEIDQKFELAVDNLNGATKGPDTINRVANNAKPDADTGDQPAAGGGSFAIPYNLQTGLTRYAPMQPIPGTKITKKSFTPLFPTSAYKLATTPMARPTIITTQTAPQTFSVLSVENPASPQSHPTGDMAKFLARWKD